MKKKTNPQPDQPIGELRVVPDFLPPPHKLVKPKETVKVTLVIDKESMLFFKNQAKSTGIKYQRMMRQVLKGYAKMYSKLP